MNLINESKWRFNSSDTTTKWNKLQKQSFFFQSMIKETNLWTVWMFKHESYISELRPKHVLLLIMNGMIMCIRNTIVNRNDYLCRPSLEVPASVKALEPKDGQGAAPEDAEQEEPGDNDDELDDDSIFTCDNCQQDFECLAELTEHRTNHCPAGGTHFIQLHHFRVMMIWHARAWVESRRMIFVGLLQFTVTFQKAEEKKVV